MKFQFGFEKDEKRKLKLLFPKNFAFYLNSLANAIRQREDREINETNVKSYCILTSLKK